jgi:hypothetical protein
VKKKKKKTATEKFMVINILGGIMTEFESETMITASAVIVSQFINRDKKWDAKPTERYSQDDAVYIDGYNKNDGGKLFLLVIKKKEFDKDTNVFDGWQLIK